MALFYSDELVDMAMSVYNDNKAVSDVCTSEQYYFLYSNFGLQYVNVSEDEYYNLMSLWLLFINEYLKTDGETI